MKNNNLLQDGDQMLNNLIIDCINNLDFNINYYFENVNKFDDLSAYLYEVFDNSFFEYLQVKHGFFYECIKAFEIYVHFCNAKINNNILYFEVETETGNEQISPVYQTINKSFEFEIK